LKISILGMGYVGTVSAGCLAHEGHQVVGVDAVPTKVDLINEGRSPIIEADISELIEATVKAGQLRATCDQEEAVHTTELSFVCVGTPSQRNGKLSLDAVERVCTDIGRALKAKNEYHWVVLRSTVLPGTTDNVVIPSLERSSGKRAGRDFGVCFHPEFLREGSAVADFFEPPFTIFGTGNHKHTALLRELYHWMPGRLHETTAATAEMIKYVCNAFHAVKVGFANEIGSICKQLGVDTETVAKIFMSDMRLNISTAYLKPGFAFGGSCLPKDIRAILYKAKQLDLELPMLGAVLETNRRQVEVALDLIRKAGRNRVGVLGLSFKAGTDDLRESPVVVLIETLIGKGYRLAIYDEEVALARLIGANKYYIEQTIPHISSLMVRSPKEVIDASDVVVISKNTPEIREAVANHGDSKLIIDLIRLPQEAAEVSRNYDGICW